MDGPRPTMIPDVTWDIRNMRSQGLISQMVQWLRIHLAMQEIRVRSLARELRSHMLSSN